MRIKLVVKDGETLRYKADFKICGAAGVLGKKAVQNLMNKVNEIWRAKTVYNVELASATAAGYARACMDFGYIDDSCRDELEKLILLARDDAWKKLREAEI